MAEYDDSMMSQPPMAGQQKYHPLLHSMQDGISLEDGREFRKTICYANGLPVGGVKAPRRYSSDSSFDSEPRAYYGKKGHM